ncbi:MAG: EamA family transporter [Candidatus Bathyarchaeia archaeon]|jgi:drug/metabolite transporter (DMT)-like permease
MAAIDKRKNVKDSAAASVANLMKIALVPKAIAAIVKDDIPLDNSNLPHANGLSKLQFLGANDYELFVLCQRLAENSYLEFREVRERCWSDIDGGLALKNQLRGALLVMGAGFLWGFMGILAKLAYAQSIGPISLAWFRLVVAIPLLGLFLVIKRYSITVSRHEMLLFIGFGFCSLTVFEALYFTAYAYTTVQHAAALLYTAPAFVAVLSWVILKEKFSRAKVAAVTLSVTGAFLIVGIARGQPLFGSITQLGDWLAIASGLAYSSWYIFGKILGQNREPAVTTFLAMIFGALLLFPIMFALEGVHPPANLYGWGLIVVVGLVPTAVAYVLYLTGLKLIEPTQASVFAIVEPLTAAVVGFLFLQERLSYDSIVGFVLIISSIVLLSLRE